MCMILSTVHVYMVSQDLVKEFFLGLGSLNVLQNNLCGSCSVCVCKHTRDRNFGSINFAVKLKSVKTAKIMLLENLALYGSLVPGWPARGGQPGDSSGFSWEGWLDPHNQQYALMPQTDLCSRVWDLQQAAAKCLVCGNWNNHYIWRTHSDSVYITLLQISVMDSAILSVAHSPPSAVDVTPGNAAELPMDGGQVGVQMTSQDVLTCPFKRCVCAHANWHISSQFCAHFSALLVICVIVCVMCVQASTKECG